MHLRAPGRRRHALLTIAVAVAAAGCSGSGASRAATPASTSPPTTSPPTVTRGVTARVVVRRRATLPRGSARAVLVADHGTLLLLGGLDATRNTTGQILRIAPTVGTVTDAGSLGIAVHDAAASELAGRPTVFGGGNTSETASVQAVGAAGTTTIGRLPVPRSDLAAASVAGRVYLVGGYDGTRVRATTISTADGIAFQVLGDLPVPVRYAAVAARGRDVYVVGGTTTGSAGGAVAEIQVLDTTTGAVRSAGRLPFPLTDAVAATLHGHLYVIGGLVDGRPSDRIWRLDPPSGALPAALVPVATLPVPLADAAVAVDHGVAYVAGGESPALSSAVFSVTER